MIKLYAVSFKLTQSLKNLLFIYMYNIWLKPNMNKVREKNVYKTFKTLKKTPIPNMSNHTAN